MNKHLLTDPQKEGERCVWNGLYKYNFSLYLVAPIIKCQTICASFHFSLYFS
jgi:hypothetical protein